MLWVVAFFVTIAAVMVGIGRWKRANNPLYALDERNRKVWLKGNKKPPLPSRDDWIHDPAYSLVPGNIFYDDHEYSVLKDD